MLELSEIKKDLQAKEDLVKAMQSESHKLQYVHVFDLRQGSSTGGPGPLGGPQSYCRGGHFLII